MTEDRHRRHGQTLSQTLIDRSLLQKLLDAVERVARGLCYALVCVVVVIAMLALLAYLVWTALMVLWYLLGIPLGV
jgi:hypothetical protein